MGSNLLLELKYKGMMGQVTRFTHVLPFKSVVWKLFKRFLLACLILCCKEKSYSLSDAATDTIEISSFDLSCTEISNLYNLSVSVQL